MFPTNLEIAPEDVHLGSVGGVHSMLHNCFVKTDHVSIERHAQRKVIVLARFSLRINNSDLQQVLSSNEKSTGQQGESFAYKTQVAFGASAAFDGGRKCA